MQVITFGTQVSHGIENGCIQTISLAPAQVEEVKPATQKGFAKVATQIKQTYKTVREVSQVIVFEAGSKLFAAAEDQNGAIAIYQCYQDTHDIVFLPGFKTGKSFKAVSNFVQARTAA